MGKEKELLTHLATEYNAPVALKAINDERFPIWSGSSKPHQHHYGKSGLIIHTTEVIKLALDNNYILGSDIDERELFLSCLFHDVGKMWDYTPGWSYDHKEYLDPNVKNSELTKIPDYSVWEGNDHKRKIHHISRSALTWNQYAIEYGEEQTTIDNVLHAVLAHHGLREWGSPVMPSTKLAWMLHLCDGISARMNDADKWDHTSKEQ